ncbi:Methyl farnesoate epoxidase [Folsomia candida]|uniref:Methyl farnesoate epoxidase n=1 Tax=Folsomia candida TaxID=158441 RepID=A0A226DD99_FOLCA|nr:Methyl farnesoate epoxidase [Folsomia candida]
MLFHVMLGIVAFICTLIKLNLRNRLWGTSGSTGSNKPCPPGPWCFPLFGYMPFFAYKPLERLQALASNYGEICTIFLGQYRQAPVVVLNSYYTIREAFKEDAFSGRPTLKMLEVRNSGANAWSAVREKLGRNNASSQCDICEILVLGNNPWKDGKVGTPVDLKARLNLAVLNALWSIICGQRYSHDDGLVRNSVHWATLIPPLAPRLTRWNAFVHSISAVHRFLQDIIEEHKQERSTQGRNSGGMKDFIDLYLSEIDATSDPASSFYKERGEHSLLITLLDLFMAGADTTSATLYWAFLYMVLHEDVQRKVHNEIDLVLGNSPPSLDHKKLMPYTEAVLLEILRKSSLVPMGLFHSTTSNTKLLGFDIPKDTVIMANLYNLNNDAAYWGDPQTFRPERFLDDSKTTVVKFERFIPFSTGKRSCPGENLSRDQLFLFFVGLLQKFIFVSDYARPKPSDKPNNGVILSASPYTVVVRSRVVGVE